MHMLFAPHESSRRHTNTEYKTSHSSWRTGTRHATPDLVTKLSDKPCTKYNIALHGQNMWHSCRQGQPRLEHADGPLRLAEPPRCLHATQKSASCPTWLHRV